VGADGPDEQRLLVALVEELMKKSDLCWLRLPGADRDRVVWHIWHEGAAYVVSGGSEQPAPGLESVDSVTVVARAKDSRQRMLAWRAEVSTVLPGTPEWDSAVPALVSGRLNLRDLDTAAQRWAEECTVSRLTPSGVVEEQPGAMPDADHAAPPLPTPATTRLRLPRVLHRRQTRRPNLRSD
jgi:hypothetical protein